MTGIRVVYRRDLRQLTRSGAFIAVVVVILAIAVGMGIGAGYIARNIMNQAIGTVPAGTPGQLPPLIIAEISNGVSRAVAGNVLFYLALLAFLPLLWAFAGPIMTAERSSGTLPSLLATPLTVFELWAGKSLALFVATLVLEFASIGLNLAGYSVVFALIFGTAPPVAAATFGTVLLGTPLVVLALVAGTIGIAFIRGSDAALIPSFLVGFAIMLGVPAATGAGLVDVIAPGFFVGYLGFALVLMALLIPLGRSLTKESIVLSTAVE